MNWQFFNISEIDSKWDEWDRLNGLYYNFHPFFDSRFIRPCIKYFGGNSIKLAQLKNSRNEIIGLLLIKKNKLGSWNLFYTPQMQIIPVLLNKNNASMEIKALIRSLCDYCWRLECTYQDPEFTPLNIIDDGLVLKYYHCTTTRIDLNNNFEHYWRLRKKNLQKNINRYFNRLKKDNVKISFKKINHVSELVKGLIRYGLLESLGWKGEVGTAIHPSNIQGLFYGEVIRLFGESGQASICELYLNKELAASRICLNNKDINIILKVTYNEKFKQFSPGKLLLFEMIKDEFNKKHYQHIEFYTNASKEQISWSSSTRDIYHLEVLRNRLFANLVKLKDRKFNQWKSWKKLYE